MRYHRKMRNRRDRSFHMAWSKVLSARFALVLLRFAATLMVLSAPGISELLRAQNVNVRHWTSRDGLPAYVMSITQTQDGSLWIGTYDGLAKFDGVKFSVFTPHDLPQLDSVAVRIVAVGTDSELYVGTDGGLTVLDHGHARSLRQPSESGSSQISMVLPVGPDEAWYGTTLGGLYHYGRGSVEKVDSVLLPHEQIYGLAMAPDKTLWIATGGGLFSLSQGRFARYQPAVPLPVLQIYDLAFSQDGSLFAASDAGLFQIQGGRWKLFTKKDGLPSNSINILAMGTKGSLWIGTTGGLAEMKHGDIRSVTSIKCSVNSLLQDREDSLWLGCSDAKGLTRITFPQVKFLETPKYPGSRLVSLLLQGQDGTVWTTSQKGLFRQKTEADHQLTRQKGLQSDNINSIALSAKGTLWVAMDYGLASLDRGQITQIHTKKTGLPDTFFRVLEDRRGTLWATTPEGLSRRRSNESSLHPVPGFDGSIQSLVEGPDGAVWVNTYSRGLHRFVGDREAKFGVQTGLGSDRIYDSVEDGSGTTWVWTAGGLGRIQNDKCANLGEANGFPTDTQGSVVLDQRGHLWIFTQKGVAVVDLDETNRVIDHGGLLQNTRYLGADDGLGDALGDTSRFDPVLMTSGDVWIPTPVGIAAVSPAVLEEPLKLMAPQTTSLATDVGERDLGSVVRIKPEDQHLLFSYNVPYLRGVGSREYRYRLKGFDPDWRVGTKTRDAMYTSLPAGRYRFEVSSRFPFEAWTNPSVPIDLLVMPHFYQTWWWYTLVALTLCFLLALIFWLRLRFLQTSYTTMLMVQRQERSRLARELHDTLSRGMMAIHMKIQLATALLSTEPDSASSHLESAVGILRQSASETRQAITSLRLDTQESRKLQDVVDRAVFSFKQHSAIQLETQIHDDLPQASEEVSHEIAQIIEEALTNVRLHSKADKASLSVCKTKTVLKISVNDNGRGFDVSHQALGSTNHFGLIGMKERARSIHGDLEITSLPGEGTQILFQIFVLNLTRCKR